MIANRITTAGPGFFIYFNQGLDLPRLVFSTDLNDPTADLKILFRMTNLTGQGGRDAMPTFTASNFEFTTVPEPSSVLIMTAGAFPPAFTRGREDGHVADALWGDAATPEQLIFIRPRLGEQFEANLQRDHSIRSATVGSMRVALTAGK